MARESSSGRQTPRSTAHSREVWGNDYGGNMRGRHAHQFSGMGWSLQYWGTTISFPIWSWSDLSWRQQVCEAA